MKPDWFDFVALGTIEQHFENTETTRSFTKYRSICSLASVRSHDEPRTRPSESSPSPMKERTVGRADVAQVWSACLACERPQVGTVVLQYQKACRPRVQVPVAD